VTFGLGGDAAAQQAGRAEQGQAAARAGQHRADTQVGGCRGAGTCPVLIIGVGPAAWDGSPFTGVSGD